MKMDCHTLMGFAIVTIRFTSVDQKFWCRRDIVTVKLDMELEARRISAV